jgi:uncharacterized small protein (TIGR04563 family)
MAEEQLQGRKPRDKRKQSVYVPEDMLEEISIEARRLDRSLSWFIQQCVRGHMPAMKKLQEHRTTKP